MKLIFVLIITLATSPLIYGQKMELFEDFKAKGKPNTADSVEWSYTDQLLPVKSWEDIAPGDGFAYLTIDADPSNDRKKKGKDIKWPFQMIQFSSVGPGHRLEVRAKNTVIQGVASFIFTYNEANNLFDEIDIEIVGDDTQAKPTPHATDATGWTDARFNTWADADTVSCKPGKSFKKPVLDKSGKKVSHQDGKFHIYTIDWHKNKVEFFIDGVLQQTITECIPQKPTTVLVGMRHMSWTGKLDWEGTRMMIVDWIRIKPLKSTD